MANEDISVENGTDFDSAEVESFPTFVTLRPNYDRCGLKYRNFKDKDITYSKGGSYIRHDAVKSKHTGLYYEKNVSVKSKTIRTRTETEKTFFIPSLGVSGRNKRRNQDRIYELFGSSTYDFAVIIGVEPERMHDGLMGSCSYSKLFACLDALGYDPLAPLHDQQLLSKFEHKLAAFIYAEAKKMRENKDYSSSMKRKVEAWARNVRDYVRDYIMGGDVPVFKDSPAHNTIQSRISRSKKNGGLYKFGIMNALYETGALCADIKVIDVVPIHRIVKPPTPKNSGGMKSLDELLGDNYDARKVSRESIEDFTKKIEKSSGDYRTQQRRLYEGLRDMVISRLKGEGFKPETFETGGFEFLKKNDRELYDAFASAARIVSGFSHSDVIEYTTETGVRSQWASFRR